MKRCPECQFLYEDESNTCEMDGTPLRYTIKLPTLPGLAQSIWDTWTIAMLFAVVLITVLVILYRAAPAGYTSTSGGRMAPVKIETPATTPDQQSAGPAASPESSEEQTAPDDSASPTDARDPFESPSNTPGTKSRKSKPGLQAEDGNEPTPAPVIHIQATTTTPGMNTSSSTAELSTTATKSETFDGQKTVAKPGSSANSNHPLPPAASTNKANTAAQKPESGFKSMLKKAGKVLKKPFGDN